MNGKLRKWQTLNDSYVLQSQGRELKDSSEGVSFVQLFEFHWDMEAYYMNRGSRLAQENRRLQGKLYLSLCGTNPWLGIWVMLISNFLIYKQKYF